MESHLDFTPLLLVLFLAFITPLALSRYRRIPVVVGEILVGILIGQSVLGLADGDEPILSLLSTIGFAFLMFLSGLEIDFSLLLASTQAGPQKQGRRPLVIAGLSFLITLLLAFAIGWGLAAAGMVRDAWMMGLILSTTSLGIVVPVLKERGLTGGRFGQAVLLAALVADFSTMFLITVYVTLRSQGMSLDILLIGVLFMAFLLVYRVGRWQLRRPGVRNVFDELSGATTQVKVRGAMALMIAFVVLAEFLGVELILGAFLAGAILSLLSRADDHTLRNKLDGIGFGFFIPLFFIVVGIRFDLQAFLNDPNAWLLAPLLLAAAFAIKFISALVFRPAFNWRETLAAGALLSARLSLIIAASAIGLRLNAISEATNSAIILVAALTATFAPLIFNTLLPEAATEPSGAIWIYGMNDTGLQVARTLQKHGEQVRLVGVDARQAARFRSEGFEADTFDVNTQAFPSMNGATPKALIAVGADDERNLAISRAACQAGITNIVALVNEPARLREYRDLEVKTFTPTQYQPIILSLLARNPDLFHLLTEHDDGQDVREVSVRRLPAAGLPIRHLGLPGNLLILSVRRNGELIIPHGNTRIEPGDQLTILGDIATLDEAAAALENVEQS
jgi:Kef-type K+ transport system membrane component KefB/Trk K+ transport system NAD-binding subunit